MTTANGTEASASRDRAAEPDCRVRFAAVISHPIQHFGPLFRSLAAVPGLRVRAFYCCDWGVKPYHDPGFGISFAWDVGLLDGYEHEFLAVRRRPRRLGFWDVDNPRVAERLEAYQPHVVWLHGYGHRTCWRAARWASGKAALLHFGDSELVHPRSWWRRALKRMVLTRHFRRCAAFITVGDNNEAYYRSYGVPEDKLFRGAYPVDVQRFRTTLTAPSRPARETLRRRFGIPADALVAVQVGKLQPSKRPMDFVEAFGRLRAQGVRVWGLMVGDGPLRPEVEARIRSLALEDRVRVTGFVNQAEIPFFFDAADLLVTASELDPHPLVVTEGLVAGLPVVASDRVGCIGPTDTARPGVNALVYPCGAIDPLADSIRTLVEDAQLRRRMSAASLEIASTQDARVTAQAVVRAVRHLLPQWASRWPEVMEGSFDTCANPAGSAAQAGLPGRA